MRLDQPHAPRRRFRSLAAMFTTSATVGIVATVVDWLVLVAAVWVGMSERWAIVPAFLAGVVVQFFGLAPPISLDSRLATTKGSSERGVRDVPAADGEEGDRRS